ATARRDGERARSATMHALTAERDANVGRVAAAVRAGAADRVAELGAEFESRRARRSAAEAESALAPAPVDVEAALEGPPRSAAHDHTAGEESAHGGAPERVTLSHDAVASAGIETVAVAHVTTPAEIDAFGRVLDPMPVVDALHARAAARSAAATARAEHARVVRLRADPQH